MYRLFTEGILPGVSSVLSFIPTIAAMIFCLALFRELGIIRGSAARFIMGFSCSVPAIMSCAGIADKRRRFITAMLIPYMSCSAKLPIYVMMASMFFPKNSYIAVGGIYIIGIVIALAAFTAAKRLRLLSGSYCEAASSALCNHQPARHSLHTSKRFAKPFTRLKRPDMRVVFDEVWSCCTGFVKKAFTVILAASVVIWLLQNLDTTFRFTSNIEESLLAQLGRLVAPLLAPVGFGDWRAAAALITGLSAKEAVVSTFAVIAGAAGGPALCTMLEDIFSPLSAFCFMVFCLAYMPCIATLAAIRSVTGRLSISLAVMTVQTLFAWLLSFLIFHLVTAII